MVFCKIEDTKDVEFKGRPLVTFKGTGDPINCSELLSAYVYQVCKTFSTIDVFRNSLPNFAKKLTIYTKYLKMF